MNQKFIRFKSSFFLTFFCCLLSTQVLIAQADFGGRTPVILRLTTDFGADSTGATDASFALIKASRYIENKWDKNGDTLQLSLGALNINYDTSYVRLEIPSGIYKIGEEISLTTSPYDSLYVNSSTNPGADTLLYSTIYGSGNASEGVVITPIYNPCNSKYLSKRYYFPLLLNIQNDSLNQSNRVDGVEIVGVGSSRPIFRYADSLRVGWMDTLGQAINGVTGVCVHQWPLFHKAANCIDISFCNNIKIRNIEIDGNIQYASFMGTGTDGYQEGAMGLRLNAKHVTLENLFVHHMQMDGINLADAECDSTTYFYADTIVCEYKDEVYVGKVNIIQNE